MSEPTACIVCVDDEPMVLTSLREQFQRQFGGTHEIEVAQDAAEALELVDELLADGHPVPLVISDHIMPGMKGDELLVRLRAKLPDTRMVLLTGQAGVDAVGRAVNEAGLYRYIAKPWDRDDLALTVREAVAGFHTERTVAAQQAHIASAHEAALHFVPDLYFELLGRRDITEVQRGDCATRELGMFFSDIRGFTTLVEGRTPEANLAWLNAYLEISERPIRAEHGFVQDIVGDGILAVFGGGADAAVRAAIGCLAALEVHNRERVARGDRPIRIGLGVNTGEVLLGVLGGRQRWQTNLVGDAVNLASRVEGLTKHLGTLLITGATRDRLADPGRYVLRDVGRVQVVGRTAPTALFECLDALPADERDRKLATRDALAAALSRYRSGDLDAADAAFRALAAADPHDRLFPWYRARIATLRRDGLPSDWDGTTPLRHK